MTVAIDSVFSSKSDKVQFMSYEEFLQHNMRLKAFSMEPNLYTLYIKDTRRTSTSDSG